MKIRKLGEEKEKKTMIRTVPCGLKNNYACKWISDNFPGMLTYMCFFPGKLSEIHLHAWLFANPQGKVLIIVGISCCPDLRVQHLQHWSNTKLG